MARKNLNNYRNLKLYEPNASLIIYGWRRWWWWCWMSHLMETVKWEMREREKKTKHVMERLSVAIIVYKLFSILHRSSIEHSVHVFNLWLSIMLAPIELLLSNLLFHSSAIDFYFVLFRLADWIIYLFCMFSLYDKFTHWMELRHVSGHGVHTITCVLYANACGLCSYRGYLTIITCIRT